MSFAAVAQRLDTRTVAEKLIATALKGDDVISRWSVESQMLPNSGLWVYAWTEVAGGYLLKRFPVERMTPQQMLDEAKRAAREACAEHDAPCL